MIPERDPGHPEYGCFITKEKTMSNFDYDHQVMNVVDSRTRREYMIVSGRCHLIGTYYQIFIGVVMPST